MIIKIPITPKLLTEVARGASRERGSAPVPVPRLRTSTRVGAHA